MMGKTIGGIMLSVLLAAACRQADRPIAISVSYFETPLLRRVEGNPFMLIKASPSGPVPGTSIRSITLDLSASDDLSDIHSVEIYDLGQDSVAHLPQTTTRFGTALPAGRRLVFEGEADLSAPDVYLLVSARLSPSANLHHKVRVRCTGVTLDNVTKATPPVTVAKGQRIAVGLRMHNDDGVHTYRIPGLTTTNAGTLLATYDVRRNSSRDLQGDIDIGLSRSTDGGSTWEPMRIVLDMRTWGDLPQKFNGVSDACILVDRNTGKIFVAGLWMHGVINEDGVWQKGLDEASEAWNHQWRNKGSQPGFGVRETAQFLITSSVDDGRTWSEPLNMTTMVKRKEWWLFAPAPGHGIVLDDGTLVFPTQGRDQDGVPFSNITYSRDGGETWTSSNPAFSGVNENMVVQRTDGSIMLNARYGKNRGNQGDDNGRVVMTTADLGKTWNEHHTSRSALIEPTCMASLHKHVYHDGGEEKSVLLFSNPNSKTGRHHMTIKVSFDEGETWPEGYWMLLDEGQGRGYSCITSIDEKTIGILYEGSAADMTFESIPLDELINPGP